MLRELEVRFEQCVGNSTLTAIGLMATEGVEALYQLNGRCEGR